MDRIWWWQPDWGVIDVVGKCIVGNIKRWRVDEIVVEIGTRNGASEIVLREWHHLKPQKRRNRRRNDVGKRVSLHAQMQKRRAVGERQRKRSFKEVVVQPEVLQLLKLPEARRNLAEKLIVGKIYQLNLREVHNGARHLAEESIWREVEGFEADREFAGDASRDMVLHDVENLKAEEVRWKNTDRRSIHLERDEGMVPLKEFEWRLILRNMRNSEIRSLSLPLSWRQGRHSSVTRSFGEGNPIPNGRPLLLLNLVVIIKSGPFNFIIIKLDGPKWLPSFFVNLSRVWKKFDIHTLVFVSIQISFYYHIPNGFYGG